LDIPLAFSAVFFLGLAAFEWRRLPLIGRIYLGVATAFTLGAVAHPGMTIVHALDHTNDGLTWVLAAARVAGFTAVLVSAVTFLRGLALRR